MAAGFQLQLPFGAQMWFNNPLHRILTGRAPAALSQYMLLMSPSAHVW